MTQEDSIVHTNPASDPTNAAAAAPQSTAPPTNEPHDDPSTQSYSADDLIALIRAIKFAHPEMSQRHVHSEITTVAADSDPSYHFLKHVHLNDVKKVWKKALRGSDSSGDGSAPIATQKEDQTDIPNKQKQEEEEEIATPIFPPNSNNGILKFYTVGDASVQTLAQNYATHYARAAAQASTNNNDNNDATASNYTHFFLDVPADRSGSRPHQALINYSDSNVVRTTMKDQRTHPTTKSSSSSSSSSHHGNNNKKKEKKKNRSNANQRPSNDTEGREIFKIQMAAPPPGMEDVSLPMLLYNADRSAKTFLHPPSTRKDGNIDVGEGEEEEEDDDGGYFKIQERIRNNGTCGALGKSGGQKAYFWGIVREVEGDDQRRVVSLDVEELAPNQVW